MERRRRQYWSLALIVLGTIFAFILPVAGFGMCWLFVLPFTLAIGLMLKPG